MISLSHWTEWRSGGRPWFSHQPSTYDGPPLIAWRTTSASGSAGFRRRAEVPSDSGLVDERLHAGGVPPLHHHLYPSDADGLAITGEAKVILEAPGDQLTPGHCLTY